MLEQYYWILESDEVVIKGAHYTSEDWLKIGE